MKLQAKAPKVPCRDQHSLNQYTWNVKANVNPFQINKL